MGDRLLPLGTICLLVIARTGEHQDTLVVDFLVIDCPSAYNTILGRSTLNRLKVVTSTYYLLMRFPIKGVVGKVRDDQVAARECYMASLKGESALRETMVINSLEV